MKAAKVIARVTHMGKDYGTVELSYRDQKVELEVTLQMARWIKAATELEG